MPTVVRTIPPPTNRVRAGRRTRRIIGLEPCTRGMQPATASSNNADILTGTLEKLSTTSIEGEPTLEVSRGIRIQGKLRSNVMPFGPKYAASPVGMFSRWICFPPVRCSLCGSTQAIEEGKGASAPGMSSIYSNRRAGEVPFDDELDR
jgi:hypothetical protein